MIVRPSLHSQTALNAAAFGRWTAMHFRDLLNLAPTTPGAESISRTIRYSNNAGELFYTIHADDVAVFQTPAYHAVSRRLDLENTRDVGHGEEAVLPTAADLGLGDEPMVWHLVNAEFGIFVEQSIVDAGRDSQPYQRMPLALFSVKEDEPCKPACLLVTLTVIVTVDSSDDETREHRGLEAIQQGLVKFLSVNNAMTGKIHTSLYRHVPSAQPDMHPTIADGLDGNGQWVVCLLIEGHVDEASRKSLRNDLEAWKTKNGAQDGEVASEDGSKDMLRDAKVGVWSCELFMS